MSTPSTLSPAPPHHSNPRSPAREIHHGAEVIDEFRWLENGNDPAVRTWTEAQKRRTRSHLQSIECRDGVLAELAAMFNEVTHSYSGLVARPCGLVAFKFQPPKRQRLLVMLAIATAGHPIPERILLDPNELEPKGHVAIDWVVPSPDDNRVAVCLSEYGSEEGTLHFYDLETLQALPDRIPRVQYPTGGGSAAWEPDGLGVFYTRYPHPDDRPSADLRFHQQIYRHRLDTPDTSDEYAVGGGFPRIACTALRALPGGRWLLASVANGDGGRYAHWLLDMKQKDPCAWRQVTRFEDSIKEVSLGEDGTVLYLRSVQDSPRGKILRLPTDGSVALADAPVLFVAGSMSWPISVVAVNTARSGISTAISPASRMSSTTSLPVPGTSSGGVTPARKNWRWRAVAMAAC